MNRWPTRIAFGSLVLALALVPAQQTGHAQHSRLAEFLRTEGVLFAAIDRQPIADARFFGTYCLAKSQPFCKSIPILPDPCITLDAVRIHIEHTVLPTGAIVTGSGAIRLDGKRGDIALSGSVLARGTIQMAAVVPGLGKQRGQATLSEDGLELSTSVHDHTIALRKDACGNNAPVVSLTAVGGPSFNFGESVMLVGQITDEDTTFATERIVFSSNRQGVLPGWRPAARTLVTTVLAPGPHTITIRVTDSGGLTAQAQLNISVTNHPPVAPVIYLPLEGATLVAGGSAVLKGSAIDPDSGPLTDAALSWSAQLTAGGEFTPLGFGSEFPATFAAPADPVRIRLTATDSGGSTASSERLVHVIANAGNTPPVVVIHQPERGQSSSSIAAGALAGSPMTLVATVFDAESLPTDLQLKWTFELLGSNGQPNPAPPLPNPAPITGTLAPSIAFPAVAGTYRATFSATDPGGMSASDSVEIAVSTSIIL